MPECFLDRLCQPLMNSRALKKKIKCLVNIDRSCSCDILLLTFPDSAWENEAGDSHLPQATALPSQASESFPQMVVCLCINVIETSHNLPIHKLTKAPCHVRISDVFLMPALQNYGHVFHRDSCPWTRPQRKTGGNRAPWVWLKYIINK